MVDESLDPKTAVHEPAATGPARRARQWLKALGLGLVVELTIVGLLCLLPRESWLFGKVFSFLEYTHYPFMWYLNAAGPESDVGGVVALFLILVCMAFIWGYLALGGGFLLRLGLSSLGLSPGQRQWVGIGAGILCAAGVGFLLVDVSQERPVPFSPTPAVNAVVEGNTALAIDLYKKLGAAPGNVFFSPYSISAGLGLVYAGARGQTESELARAAHFTVPPGELHQAFRELADRMEKVQRWKRLTLVSANALWAQQEHPFLGAFQDVARNSYGAKIEAVDFTRDAAAISSRVNAWVERQTRGKIRGLLPAGQLDAATKLLLCDTLYFKGDWKNQFKESDTRPAPFHVSADKTVIVPLMSREADVRIARVEEPRATLLQLPYYGCDLAMVIILPDEVNGLGEVERALTPQSLKSWLASLDARDKQEAVVGLPRFTLRQGADLVPVLRSLGMNSAFEGAADLSGMDGTTNLFLSAALHQAFVEVNEQGTEAAAGTLFRAESKSMASRFIADHPFLFLIRDRGSGAVLFLGRVVNPR